MNEGEIGVETWHVGAEVVLRFQGPDDEEPTQFFFTPEEAASAGLGLLSASAAASAWDAADEEG